jgi:primosomal replication protein N
MTCIALGQNAEQVGCAALGMSMAVSGFLAGRSLKRRKVVLHVNEIEFQEGNWNGI